MRRKPTRIISKTKKNEIVEIDENSVGIVTTFLGGTRTYIIDKEDLPRVRNIKWTSSASPGCPTYCRGTLMDQHKVRLHRLIMSFPDGLIDHIDMDTCNNRKSNLRIATYKQNKINQRVRRDSSSGIKGVYKRGERYRAVLSINGRSKIIGYFGSKREAAIAYNQAASEHFGEFAFVNDIDGLD